MRSLSVVIFLFISLLFFSGNLKAQGEEQIRPRYMPMGGNHRNVKDDLGRKQGLWKFYSFDGTLIREENYLNDVKHGQCIKYHVLREYPIEEINYFNGKKDGTYKKYYSSGELKTEGNYKEGYKCDDWVSYYKVNGEKKSEGKYVNGKKEGKWLFYNSKGVLVIVGNFKNDLRDGVWEYFDAEGKPTGTKTFVKDAEVVEGAKTKEVKKPGVKK